MMLTFTLVLEKVTTNALRYEEVGADGRPVSADAALLGKMYVRKAAFVGEPPKTLVATITYDAEAKAPP
ncbi:MAG TPA: hypothetical protein VGH62_11900 [Bradyrhizobium sp.]|jgi:hypothetical protein